MFTALSRLLPGYVRLHTNYGDLNIELYCDQVSAGTSARGALEQATKVCLSRASSPAGA